MYQFETENLLIFELIPITGTVLSCQTGHAYHQHRHSGTTDVCFRFRQSLQLLLKVLEKFKIQTVFLGFVTIKRMLLSVNIELLPCTWKFGQAFKSFT